MELQILLAAGVPMPAAHPPSNHYNATRTEYYRQLEDASESGGDVVPFIRYAMQGFVDGIRQQVLIVWGQQYADRWERFIYETFGGHVSSNAEKRGSPSASRCQLTKRSVDATSPALSVDLAIAYAGTERMLSRDLNALQAMGLIEPSQSRHGWWRITREQILAFRPVRRGP
jgi:hypothetical protein